MPVSNLLKKKPLYSVSIWLFLLFSCTSGTEKNSMQDVSEQGYQIPRLTQQEIIGKDSGDMTEYPLYNSIMEEGPVIPGIFQSAVPQGMAYYEESDLMFISNYMFDGRPSCITGVSMADGKPLKTLWLLNPDGSPHMGHVGGLAVSKKYLWIASGKGVYYVSLETLINKQDNANLEMIMFVPTAAKGSFATYSDGILWVGEFTSRDHSYTTPDFHHFKTKEGNVNHALMAGFILDSESDMIRSENAIAGISYPDYILSVPHEVQGASFIKDKIILSRSYGRKNNSRISVYSNPLDEIPQNVFVTENSRSIPVWILDEQNLEQEITAPPMTEGIVNYKGSVGVLFESGSDKYRATAKNPQDRIHFLTHIP